MYKAERGERLFAIKFLADLELTGWNRREITLMLRLQLPNVVGFRACERWPHPDLGYPYIVMDYVPGLTMDQWAQSINPTARVGVHTFLKVARAMREVHRLEVLHRDLKETNIMIRADDGEPVVIDFGFGAMKGVPTETKPGRVPPGTPEYRSPEMIKFLRGETEEITYTYTLSDELWAMGVLLYWLLTDEMPFGDRMEQGLHDRISQNTPRAPHDLNPRVPEAASRLCMRMLAKDPRERFKGDDELCAALEAVLAEAEGDASWDVPLMEPPEASGESDGKPEEEQQWMAHEPRRGWWPEEEPPAREETAAPPAEPTVAIPPAPAVPAETNASRETKTAEGTQCPEAPAVPAVADGAGPGRDQDVRPLRVERVERLSLALVVGLTVAVALVVGSLSASGPEPDATPASVADGTTSPPDASAQGEVTTQAISFREVARPGNLAESESDAAPDRAQPPAPLPTAMSRKKDSRPKPEEKLTPQSPNKARRCIPIPQKVCTAAGVCTIILTGCSGAQVRPTPEPVECPAGWRETHARFDIGGHSGDVVLQGYEGRNTERATVHEGPANVVVSGFGIGDLPGGTLLSGTMQLGENRFYGTFTQARIPGGGTYPVCVVIARDAPGAWPDGSTCPVGLGECPTPESRPGNMKSATRFPVFGKSR
ncbi:serine/threonine protein kinase [Archangium violaceum]|uniref:serine/threonine protein kinase n=1 Tax=Archangium violaceum TaxID=83451 RepID=UPI001951F1AA|nr:serine/threonine-protein kinase [Archangium violaceum]QRN97457.1 serine/threonine protein kinase [Archangium violaceum]